MISSFVGLIYLVLVILAMIDCLQSNLETAKKVLWILLIWFAPVIGLILYYLLGRTNS